MLIRKNYIGEVHEYYVIYEELAEEEYIDYDYPRKKRKLICIVETEEVAKHFCRINPKYDYAPVRTDDYDHDKANHYE